MCLVDVCFASLCLHLGEYQSVFFLCDEMLLINYWLKIWMLNETAFLPKFFFFLTSLELALITFTYSCNLGG